MSDCPCGSGWQVRPLDRMGRFRRMGCQVCQHLPDPELIFTYRCDSVRGLSAEQTTMTVNLIFAALDEKYEAAQDGNVGAVVKALSATASSAEWVLNNLDKAGVRLYESRYKSGGYGEKSSMIVDRVPPG